jgi:YHS domain-containing protein
MAFIDLILLIIVVYTVSKWIWRSGSPRKKRPPAAPARQSVEEMKQDPVCGTYVPVSLAVTTLHQGKTVFFCSAACRDEFERLRKAD